MPDEPSKERTDHGGGVFTGYGIGSAVLGLVSVAAVVLGLMIWSGHRNENAEQAYQTSVLQAAADWTSVLINMNADTVDTSLRTLHDGTVGQLNADFETTVEPFKQLVLKLKSKTAGQVESVSIESLHHQLAGPAGCACAAARAVDRGVAHRHRAGGRHVGESERERGAAADRCGGTCGSASPKSTASC